MLHCRRLERWLIHILLKYKPQCLFNVIGFKSGYSFAFHRIKSSTSTSCNAIHFTDISFSVVYVMFWTLSSECSIFRFSLDLFLRSGEFSRESFIFPTFKDTSCRGIRAVASAVSGSSDTLLDLLGASSKSTLSSFSVPCVFSGTSPARSAYFVRVLQRAIEKRVHILVSRIRCTAQWAKSIIFLAVTAKF